MELKLSSEGNYSARLGGGFFTVSGPEELAQRVEMKLKARRGGFALMPEFGSRIYTLASVKPSGREAAARQFVAEALSDEVGLTLEDLTVSYRGETMLLDMYFSVDDEALRIKMSV